MKKTNKNKSKKRRVNASSGNATSGNNGKIRPLGDRILIKPISHESEKTSFGIIIPDTADKEKPEQGHVVAVGEGRLDSNGKLIAPRVKVGDKVVFSKYGYDDVKIGDEEFFILKEENILAVIK